MGGMVSDQHSQTHSNNALSVQGAKSAFPTLFKLKVILQSLASTLRNGDASGRAGHKGGRGSSH